MATTNKPEVKPVDQAYRLVQQLTRDKGAYLDKLDRYNRGIHDLPYIPNSADAEYRLLATRCITNILPLVVNTAAQPLRVVGYRRAGSDQGRMASEIESVDEWKAFKRSRQDAKQSSLMRSALSLGHAYTVVDQEGNSRNLSALKATAIFDDPANDIAPIACINVVRWESKDADGKDVPGLLEFWDSWGYALFEFTARDDKKSYRKASGRDDADYASHGFSECPVTRFAPFVDLEGRTFGVAWPLIPLQDRLNQTTFDLLVAQTHTSFVVRTVSGMAPPVRRKAVREDPDDPTSPVIDWVTETDANGNPIPLEINMSAKRLLYAEDPEARFNQLPAGPLDGLIESIETVIRQISAMAQVPPQYVIGQIANLSAEALQAAEGSMIRMIRELQSSFGESWERVLNLKREALSGALPEDAFESEVVWAEIQLRSEAQAADAATKWASAGVPRRAVWEMYPGMTPARLADWMTWAEESDAQNPDNVLAGAFSRLEAPVTDDPTALDTGL